jgi:hypothetical protein
MCLLSIVEPEETAVARQRLNNHFPAATNTHTETEKLLCGVFYAVRVVSNAQYVMEGKQALSPWRHFGSWRSQPRPGLLTWPSERAPRHRAVLNNQPRALQTNKRTGEATNMNICMFICIYLRMYNLRTCYIELFGAHPKYARAYTHAHTKAL